MQHERGENRADGAGNTDNTAGDSGNLEPTDDSTNYTDEEMNVVREDIEKLVKITYPDWDAAAIEEETLSRLQSPSYVQLLVRMARLDMELSKTDPNHRRWVDIVSRTHKG